MNFLCISETHKSVLHWWKQFAYSWAQQDAHAQCRCINMVGRAVALPASARVTKPKQGAQGGPMALAELDQLSLLPQPAQPQPEQRAWGGPDKRERIWSLSTCLVELLLICCQSAVLGFIDMSQGAGTCCVLSSSPNILRLELKPSVVFINWQQKQKK